MYLADLELPNQEYIVDLKSVLDQALRILQAMIDIASNNGWLSCTIRIVLLIQMLIQGQWFYQSDLLCIPQISQGALEPLREEISKTAKLRECNACTLAGMRYASLKHEHALESAIINVFGTRTAGDIMRIVKGVPWIKFDLSVVHIETGKKVIFNDFQLLF